MTKPRIDPLSIVTAAFAASRSLEDGGADHRAPLWEAALALTHGRPSNQTTPVALALIDAYDEGDTPEATTRKVYTARYEDRPKNRPENDKRRRAATRLAKSDPLQVPDPDPASDPGSDAALSPALDPASDEYAYVVALVRETVEPASGITVPDDLLHIIALGGSTVPRIRPSSLHIAHAPARPIAYLRGVTKKATNPLADLLAREHDVPTYVGIQVSRVLLGTAASDAEQFGSSSALIAHHTGEVSPAAARLWAAALTRAIHHREAEQARESAVRTATRATTRRAA